MIVVAVEYLNTRPFVYGIRHCSTAPSQLRDALVLAPPASCALMAARGEADVALVPVGALPKLLIDKPQTKIITSHCISSSGGVRTVVLLSNSPLDQIDTIYLDAHSRTSVQLVQVLAKKKWKISPRYVDGLPLDNELNAREAMVAIGDKVFDLEDRFAFNIDLSDQWVELTGLPFVFAVWVAISDEGLSIENQLNEALAYGVHNIERSLPDDPLRPRNLDYLTRSIEFDLSEPKRQAMNLFLSYIS